MPGFKLARARCLVRNTGRHQDALDRDGFWVARHACLSEVPGQIFAAGRIGRVMSCQEYMWRGLSVCLFLVAGCAAAPSDVARAQDFRTGSPAPENLSVPPELRPSIAESVPALAAIKNGLHDLGYNLQLSYFADPWVNP